MTGCRSRLVALEACTLGIEMAVTIDLPESLLAALRHSPSEAEKDVRLAAAIAALAMHPGA